MSIPLYIHTPEKVAYYLYGNGEQVLVLLHGFCEDASIWHKLLPELPNCRIITLDIAGFGHSATPKEKTIEALAVQVEAVLSALGVDKCVLIGHSMGGYVALAFAEAYPERLRGLGLFHSHPYSDSESKRQNRLKAIEFVERNGVLPFVKQLFYSLFAPDYARQHTNLVEEKIAVAAGFSQEAVCSASYAMANRCDRSAILEKIAVPVLFICGKQDQAIEWDVSLAQVQLPLVAQVCFLAEVGHLGMVEAPALVGGAIRDFLVLCNEQ